MTPLRKVRTTQRRVVAPAVPAIALTPTTGASTVSSSGTTTVGFTLTRSGGFTGVVTPVAAGLPSGVTASFSPTTFGVGVTSLTMTLTGSSAPAVTNDAYTVTFSGSGVTSVVYNGTVTVSAGTVLYAHSFDDGTLGAFGPWGSPTVVVDGTATGGRSVRFNWTNTGGADQDQGLSYNVPGAYKKLHVRFRYKQDATADNSGIKKTVRFRANVNGVAERAVGTIDIFENDWIFAGDDFSFSPWNIYQTGGAAFIPNTFRNAWRYIEAMVDYSEVNYQNVGLWIDGTRVITYRQNMAGNVMPTNMFFDDVYLASVFNGPSDTRSEWFDDVVIATDYIGPP